MLRKHVPNKLRMLCTALILISVSLVTRAQDVFFFWLAIEFVSLVFVGLLVSTNSASSLGQYFTANATATVFFLVGAITGNPITMRGAFIIKLGAAPAHAWVKRSMKGADWFCLWVFLGPIKLIPIVGLTTIHVE